MLEETLGYIFIAVVFYLLGRWVGRMDALYTMTKFLADNRHDLDKILKKFEHVLEEADSEEGPKSAEEIKVEKHGDQIFLYTKDNDEFISQGIDLQEALEKAAKRFPERNFRGRISKEDAESLKIKCQ